MIIEMGMESQFFYLGLIVLASFLFVLWFIAGRKGGYGPPTTLNLRKGEGVSAEKGRVIVQVDDDDFVNNRSNAQPVRDVTPREPTLGRASVIAGVGAKPPPPPSPPPQAIFIYNGHDWDAFEVLGVSPYSSFSEITRSYQNMIKKADSGKHEFLQTAYMAILKIK